MKLEFYKQSFQKINFMKIHPTGVERMDGQSVRQA
jgi:hypothetical protein